jgi:AmiR/NasT family two-component response regulator
MEKVGLSEAKAMSRLREESRNRNLKMAEVARAVILAEDVGRNR